MNATIEIWKPIKNFEGLYEVSNFGKVKTLSYNKTKQRRELKLRDTGTGYLNVALYNKRERRDVRLHQLVWDHFGDADRAGLVIDHIDNNPLNNNIDNLQLLTNRENTSRGWRQKGKTLPIGVSYHITKKKFIARININGKPIHLGGYKSSLEASDAYQEALNSLAIASYSYLTSNG